MILELKTQFSDGTISDAAEKAARIAYLLQIEVHFDFNGESCRAMPNESASAIVFRYRSGMP